MKILLCPNGYNEKQISSAAVCTEMLEKEGHTVSVSLAELNKNQFGAEECDIVVSLGGDGAFLRASQTAFAADKPIVGINNGRLGFLCAMSFPDIDGFESRLEKCRITERALFTFGLSGKRYFALNDVVIANKKTGLSVNLNVSVEGCESFFVRGDGIAVSSPTGSTAYNRSAGGPIIDIGCDVMAITPLYACDGMTRTVIVESKKKITVSECLDEATVVADGKEIGDLVGEITVEIAEKKLRTYTSGTANFIKAAKR